MFHLNKAELKLLFRGIQLEREAGNLLICSMLRASYASWCFHLQFKETDFVRIRRRCGPSGTVRKWVSPAPLRCRAFLVMVAKVSCRVHGDFTHVVRYGRTSALGSAETPLLLEGASHGPAGRWVLLQRVRYPGFPLAGRPLWAFRLGTGRDSDCRVQPRQTDAVDQFVAREANG